MYFKKDKKKLRQNKFVTFGAMTFDQSQNTSAETANHL